MRAREGEPYSGNVLYLSTFSKTLAPGLRLGWIVAPAEVIRRLVQAKQGAERKAFGAWEACCIGRWRPRPQRLNWIARAILSAPLLTTAGQGEGARQHCRPPALPSTSKRANGGYLKEVDNVTST